MHRTCPQCSTEWPADIDYCPRDGALIADNALREEPEWELLLSSGNTMGYREATPNPEALPQHLIQVVDPAKFRELKAGDEVGAYVLKELLGQGGMGTVYLAEHKLLERKVAIKVLLPEFCAQIGVVHRFFNEAQAVNQIRHPNIVDIMDCVEGEDHPPYLVMELLGGQSLTRFIRERAPVPPGAVIAIGRQICDAMAAVHQSGVVHRDLKPDNIFVSTEENGTYKVKLLDFGIAKFMASDDSFLRTMTGEPIGTPEYMSPEQIEGGGMDHRLDIYAMGVIFYEMLTGNPPFTSHQIGELLFDHLNTIPAPPSARLPLGAAHIPSGLEDAILGCLAKDRDERVQSMGQLGELLEWALDDDTSVVVLPDLEAVAEKRRERRRWIWPTVAAASAAVVLLALGGWWMMSGSRSDAKAAKKTSGAPSAASMAAPAPKGPEKKKIRVVTKPAGASIYRLSNGTFVGKTPRVVVATEGEKQMFLLRLTGYRNAHLEVRFDSPDELSTALTKDTPALPVAAMEPPVGPGKAEPRSAPRRRAVAGQRPRGGDRRPGPMPPRARAGDVDTVNPFD
ncbi:MAG: serine/threonine-protein kinase [bacterium]